MTDAEVGLPPLVQPRYHGMPRRYEETRPVIIQDFSHRRILGIGHKVHLENLTRAENEKVAAIRQAEQEVWERAEHNKIAALEKCQEETKKEHEKQIKKMIKDQEKALKEEALRVEMMMQQRALELVQEERSRGERILAEAVKKIEKMWQAKLLEAVAQAREEEKQIARETALAVASSPGGHSPEKEAHQAELQRRTSSVDKEKEAALKSQEEKLKKEKELAVTAAHEEEQKITTQKLAETCQYYECILGQAKIQSEQKQGKIEALEKRIALIDQEKKYVETKLLEVAEAFQDYIDRIKYYYPGQADYMLPPTYLDEIRKGKW